MERSLEKTGYHRDFLTNIISIQSKLLRKNNGSHQCSLVLEENVTNSYFIDRFQVEELKRLNAVEYKVLFGEREFDLEKPSYAFGSDEIWTIFIVFPLSTNKQTLIEKATSIPLENASPLFSINLPIHFRYQKPSNGEEYVYVPLKMNPRMLIQCDGENNELLNVILRENEYLAERIVVELPVGRVEDLTIVSIGTVCATLLGSIMVLLYYYKNSS